MMFKPKLINFYKKDIVQYAPNEQKVHLDTIYQILPQELNSKNKRFFKRNWERAYDQRYSR